MQNINASATAMRQPATVMYIADYNNTVIRHVDLASGIVNTVAGKWILGPGYSGNGGAATDAQLHYPYNVGTDTNGKASAPARPISRASTMARCFK